MAEKAQIGVTGLAVMGRNLARNFARHGHTVALHNRTLQPHQGAGRGVRARGRRSSRRRPPRTSWPAWSGRAGW